MILNFTKMHGCGNDYIYVDGFKEKIENPRETAVSLSKRHFSVGSDGLIMICPSETADAKMKMYNADGSEGKMCGNGVRCVAKFVYDNGICKKNPLRIETLSGIKTVQLLITGEKVTGASVDMGAPVFSPSQIPVASDEPVIGREMYVGGELRYITCVSMGNPHCVIFVPDDFDLWNFEIEKIGPKIENDTLFPEKVNVEFVKKINDSLFEMRVWERGSGETYACGTGACATVAAACMNKLCSKNTDVTVKLKGGELTVRYGENSIIMTGETVTAYYGRVEI
ncbi:MAG: diaminopimelate epimerase [Clostridiales bacterium]|nr:diaminopimelate epimerase [Clostridiales bacterium]